MTALTGAAASGGDERFRRLAAAAGASTRAGHQHVDALFDPLVQPLSDEQRSLAFAALHSLLVNIAADLVHHGGDSLARLDSDAAVLRAEGSAALRQPELASGLIHRAEEHRLAGRLKRAAASASLDSLDDEARGETLQDWLVSQEDEELSRRALIFAEISDARTDEQGEPVLMADELPPQVRATCVWAVAAAFAEGQGDDIHQDLSRAARAALAGWDTLHSAQHRAVQLAARLEERSDINSRLLLRSADEGHPLLMTACVAVRANISSGTAWGLLMRANPAAAIALLTAIGLGQGGVTRIGERLLAIRRPGSNRDDLLREAAALAADIDQKFAASLLRYWRLDPGLRAAMEDRKPAD